MTIGDAKLVGGPRPRSPLEASEDYLRSAQPRLILWSENDGGPRFKITPFIIDEDNHDWEVISEGYDRYHSPLGCPVYWRIVNRGDEQVYCSTFLSTRAQVIKCWGTKGLAYCDHITGMAVVRIESKSRR
jgi:hypothetical protein